MNTPADPLLRVRNLVKHFLTRDGVFGKKRTVHAVDGVSFDILPGETLGLVGESGCGKSTLARCVVRLLEPTDGTLTFAGRDITHLGASAMRPLRRRFQMVFQDSTGSLNPLRTVGAIIEDGLQIHKIGNPASRRGRVGELLAQVGLRSDLYGRLPSELSGGQRQRVGIARALALGPSLIVADEPVSALDVSVKAEIINLFRDVQDARKITYLFISHDLAVIRQVSDRVGVMYLGKLVEIAPAGSFFTRPAHRYSEALLSAVPHARVNEGSKRRRVVIEGDVPSPISPPSGCRFHPRCPYASEICRTIEPALVPLGPGHLAACHHPASTPLTVHASPRSPDPAGRNGTAPSLLSP
jgi:peptide/nickel transport system ATP-binding protein